jgi:hypothetical protein
MSSIKVLFTAEEIDNRRPGGYYLAVRVKIPLVLSFTPEEETDYIPPSLDPIGSPHHSDRRVLLCETRLVVFDISQHPACPTEQSPEAGDRFLAEHLAELDRALRDYLDRGSEF